MSVMTGRWRDLDWTPWVPLDRPSIRRTAPRQPGVYRIRRRGEESGRLVYIGQTGRSLRERLLSLASGVNGEECPFNDPHTAAPHLWLLCRLDGVRLEGSCAPLVGGLQALRGTEDMLLWRHRVETGISTEANYGRFYPGYSRPTNRWIVRGREAARSPGRRAAPLADISELVDVGSAHPPLQGDDSPLSAPWWQRLPLAAASTLPTVPGVYCLHEPNADEAVYIGETAALRARAESHAATTWSVAEPWLSYLPLAERTPKHVLREFESDLSGVITPETERRR